MAVNNTHWILPSSYPEQGAFDGTYDFTNTTDQGFFHYYYPVNIFLNEFDGRCTAECSAEGRHYVNPSLSDGTNEPFAYDPWKVVAYRLATTEYLYWADFVGLPTDGMLIYDTIYNGILPCATGDELSCALRRRLCEYNSDDPLCKE